MEKELNIAEVKKALEDANLYEPNMPDDMMVSFYRVINDSKSTASEEDETRRLNESQNELLTLLNDSENNDGTPIAAKNKTKPFTPKTWTSEKNIPSTDVTERNNNENKEEKILAETLSDSPKDATKDIFGFNEMAKDTNVSLTIISHKIKFVPIQNSQSFLNAGLTRKAKMLYAYHTKLSKVKTQLARMSFYPAPLPKVTCVTDIFPNSSDDVNFQETYICRSGRQTKRKIYNYDEDDDSLDGATHKKTKNSEEQDWLSKATPSKSYVRAKKADTNHISTKPDITEMNTSDTISNPINDITSSKPSPKTDTISTTKEEPKKPLVLKKLTNEDIMRRSRLFSDTPKRRSEFLFDKLKVEEEKKRKQEKVMEAFNKTLDEPDEEDNDTVSMEDVITVEDDDTIKKKGVLSITRRRPIRKRSLTSLNISVTSTSQKKDNQKQSPTSSSKQEDDKSPPKTTARKRLTLNKVSTGDNGVDALPSTSQILKDNNPNITCPICNGSFPEDKIEEHASNCGDEPVTRSVSKISRITCDICDTVVPPDSDYNLHIKECSAKQNGNL